MSPTVSKRLLRSSLLGVGPYVPGASVSETRARLGRDDLIRLNWNENLFGPLPGVTDATAAALDSVWKYPEEDYEEFRDAAARWAGAKPAEVIPGNGIQGLVLTVVSALVDPGDHVVIPRPTYGLYEQTCATAGAHIHRIDSPPTLALDLEAIAALATKVHAKLVWICDPNNPTGLRLTRDDWSAFLRALPDGCVAVADEAYADYIEPSARFDRARDVSAGHPVVVLRTFSKIFGLAGLRLGYLLVHESLAPHIHAVQEPFNVNRAALVAGIASLKQTELLSERREQVARARGRLIAPLVGSRIRALPSDANFVLLELGTDDRAVCDALAHEGVLVRVGSEFGLPGWARVTTGEEELMGTVGARLAELVDRIAAAGRR